MFKITKSINVIDTTAPPQDLLQVDNEIVSHYCQFDNWSADLGTGSFNLSEFARRKHGLSEQGDCGLLNLLRCYDSSDRHHVLELFETAAMSASTFCFSTSIIHPDGNHHPVMCVGESSNFSDNGDGTIAGLFIFPRVQFMPRIRKGTI